MPRSVKIGNQVIDPENPGMDRPVVIKEFDAGDPGAERALEMLSYGFPSTPKLFQIEKNPERITIYQEFIEGTHLQDLNPSNLEALLEILRELVMSLHSIHRQAEAVRDLTPDNIIFREGKAFFVDLSTTDVEYTPGFKPPELDGSFGSGYSRESDIYQYGVLIGHLMARAGLTNKHLSSLRKHCLAEDPMDRPATSKILEKIDRIIYKKRRQRWIKRTVFFFLGAGCITAAIWLFVHHAQRLDSMAEVVALRKKVSTGSHNEKLAAAAEISAYLHEAHKLSNVNMEAIFVTDNPLVICDGRALGLGSNVMTSDGRKGYLIGVNLEGIEISTDDGVAFFKTGMKDGNIGWSKYGEPYEIQNHYNIAIWPKENNLNGLIRFMAAHLGMKVKGDVTGSTAGLYEAATLEQFLKLYGGKFNLEMKRHKISQAAGEVPLYFPVINFYMKTVCKDFNQNLASEVKNCHLLEGKETLFSYRNDLKTLLAHHKLDMRYRDDGYELTGTD